MNNKRSQVISINVSLLSNRLYILVWYSIDNFYVRSSYTGDSFKIKGHYYLLLLFIMLSDKAPILSYIDNYINVS